jgi:hypothetical protein
MFLRMFPSKCFFPEFVAFRARTQLIIESVRFARDINSAGLIFSGLSSSNLWNFLRPREI